MTDKEAFDAWADMRGIYFSDRWIYWEGWKEGVKHEREACATACENLKFLSDKPEHNEDDCAAAIRARGNG